jgi:ABC-2 type transport system ATP-binding protein
MSSQPAVLAEGVVKRFGRLVALDGIDLTVPAGSVYALLGPNGAGKSTAVRVLTTLLRPDAGRAIVAGHDVVRDPDAVRRRIGLAGQYAAVDERLTGRANLRLVGRLGHMARSTVRERADELLERFDLTGVADKLVRTYSGGTRRRLDLAASLVTIPSVLFLDEPTTGLDPRNRATMWTLIRELVGDGTTVLLSTQYLDEADRLAGRVAVIDRGRVVAEGTPSELKASVGGERIDVAVADPDLYPDAVERAVAALVRATGEQPEIDAASGRITAPAAAGAESLVAAVRELDKANVALADIGLRRSTLDEVFLQLTGHPTTETIVEKEAA